MNRRGFLQLLAAGVPAQAIPLNRVWSFPTNIVIPKYPIHQFTPIYYDREARERLRNSRFYEVWIPEPPLHPPGRLYIPRRWVTEGELLELLKLYHPSPLGRLQVRAIQP